MPFFPSLPKNAHISHALAIERDWIKPLMVVTENVMRGPSPLTPGQRELIAAYVSKLNGCEFCFGGHVATAEKLGIDKAVIASLVGDVDAIAVEDSFKPILRYVRTLTLTPTRLSQADADAVFKAGWDERALSHAIHVAGLFAYFNRIVEGHGVEGDPAKYRERAEAMATQGYVKRYES